MTDDRTCEASGAARELRSNEDPVPGDGLGTAA
jgi:hypothetical protein